MNKTDTEDIIARIEKLEEAVFGDEKEVVALKAPGKPITLVELARNRLLKNGQQKVAVIVGYNEKIFNESPIAMSAIKELWKKGKFVGKCDPKLLERALLEGLVREPEDNVYDLGQKGEDFFEEILRSKNGN